MIIASCPLRISLVGGSTDHPLFIEKYGLGSVISFASNLRTYVSIHQDVFGVNSIEHKYSINYSKKESVHNIRDIKNELIRHCFEYLNVDELNCSLTSDIYSVGSGLAASSSYLLSLIKAIYVMRGKSITEFEICKIAEQIEKKFNPLVGQQDFYGSIGGFKRIDFFNKKNPTITFLSTDIFEEFDTSLLYTGVLRSSTSVLQSINVDKSTILLKDVEDLQKSIDTNNVDTFHNVINRSWNNKKNTSEQICNNEIILTLDKELESDNNVLSHKLCGAGNGGYYLVFSKKEKTKYLKNKYKNIEKIEVSESGIKFINLKDEFTRL